VLGQVRVHREKTKARVGADAAGLAIDDCRCHGD
jgi:hypothetical protein